MAISFKGQSVGIVIAGDRCHDFMLPHDRATMPEKIGEAFDALVATQQAELTVNRKKSADYQAKQDARDATRTALHDLYDLASATTLSRHQFHEERYTFAASKLARALAEAEAAVQLLVDHAQQHAHPLGIGIDPASHAKPIVGLRVLAEALDKLPSVPTIA